MAEDTEDAKQCQHQRLATYERNLVINCIPPQVSEPIWFQARHVFLQDTIVLTPNSSVVSRGHYANLANLLGLCQDAGALRMAVDAVALASLATRFGIVEARQLAAVQYASSLRQIRAQLAVSPHKPKSLVASISLLSLYEVSSSVITSHHALCNAD